MNKICKYILLAGVAMMAVACGKDSVNVEGEGAVSFDIQTSAMTRADEVIVPETMRIRIYNENGLIRRYTSLDEMPKPLYLVAGTYTAKIEAGDVTNTAFIAPTGSDAAAQLKQQLCYYAEEEFEILANQTSNVTITAPTINSKLTLGLKESDGENSKLSDVKITVAAVETDAATIDAYETAVDEANAPVLEFDGTGVGYFIMPEDVEDLTWAFEATHEDDGDVVKIGKIKGVEAGKGYTVNFKYSRTPDGEVGIEVLIDETITEIESDFDFKAQPQISGTGISLDETNVYTSGSTVALQCSSIYPIHELGLKVGDGSSVKFFADGAAVTNAIPGLTVTETSTDGMIVEFALAPAFWAEYPHATQSLQFSMIDCQSPSVLNEAVEQTLLFKKRGLVVENTQTDLWFNTTSFEAFVPEQATDVKILYRQKGVDAWHTLTATDTDGDKTYTAQSVASWDAGQKNVKDQTYYTLDNAATSANFIANRTYECKLVVDGEEESVFTIDTTVDQPIQESNFSSGDMTCFQSLHEDGNTIAHFWGSGNNNMTPSLCTFDNGRAKLKSSQTMGFLAAGNLFTGQFEMTGTTQGAVSFGVDYDWKARPTALKVDVEYNLGDVNVTKYGDQLKADQGVTVTSGSADQGAIYVCVIDWQSQHNVASGGAPAGIWSPENGEDAVLNTAGGKIIGYGIIYPSGNAALHTETIPIHYYNKDTKPSKKYKLILMASTSRYGDYMVGCDNSTMWIDNFEWVY